MRRRLSDPAVPWLRLRKAEIKAAFRAPSLSCQGEELLSGDEPSFSSVGERNLWSRSFKQCVFTEPEGKVGEVTRGWHWRAANHSGILANEPKRCRTRAGRRTELRSDGPHSGCLFQFGT